MFNRKVVATSAVMVSIIAMVLLLCAIPQDPEDPKNTKITPVFTSSKGIFSKYSLIDTVGRQFKIGSILFLHENLDSIGVTIKAGDSIVYTTVFRDFETADNTDTVWMSFKFSAPGARTVYFTPYTELAIEPLTANILIVEPAVITQNHPPKMSVVGDSLILPGETCTLTISSTDPEDGQEVTITAHDQPNDAVFKDGIFTWMAPKGFSGNQKVKFIALDDGYPQMADTMIITISVTSTPNAPVIRVTGNLLIKPFETCSLFVTSSDKDSGQKLTVSMSGQPDDAVLKGDTLFVWTVPGDFTGVVDVVFIVTDNGTPPLSATSSVKIIVSDPERPDTMAPQLSRTSPAVDSTIFNTAAITVAIKATDESGIKLVEASSGSVNLPVTSTPPIYSTTVAGLKINQFTTIRFIATDSSANGNKETLFVTVTYDPTAKDTISPVLRKISGPDSGTTISDPIINLIIQVSDPSSLDSVFWTQNGGEVTMLTPDNGTPGQFSLSDSVEKEGLDTFVITAIDSATRRNRTVQTFVYNYIVSPSITLQPSSKTVCAGTEVTFTVAATGSSPFAYQWRKGASEYVAIQGAVDAAYSFTPAASDDGTIFSCLVSNSGVEMAVSNLCTLTVQSLSTKPTAVATPAHICSGDSAVLSVTAGTLGTGAIWQWYEQKSSSTPLAVSKVSPNDSKWYFVKGVGGTCGDSPWDSVLISVNRTSIAPTNITASVATVCPGSPITLTQSGGTLGTGATAWQWFTDAACTQPAAGTPSTDGSQIVVSPTSITTYYVKAIGTCNETSPVNKTVTVGIPSVAPTSISSGSTSVCPGGSILLSVVGGSLGTGASWKWYTNSACTQAAAGVQSSDGSQITVTLASTTTFYARAEGSCGSTPAASKSITVNTPPVFTEPLTGGVLCDTGFFEFGYYNTAATGATPLTYIWYDIAGTELGRGTGVSVNSLTIGTIQFYCVVTDVNGCSTKSNTVAQTAYQPTIIIEQPDTLQGGYVGYLFDYSIKATGVGLTYQWQYQMPNGTWQLMGTGADITIQTPLEGYPADGNVHEIIPVRCKITNTYGCETFSVTCTLDVMPI